MTGKTGLSQSSETPVERQRGRVTTKGVKEIEKGHREPGIADLRADCKKKR